ncbi:YbhB/YbcL family Raf kinase inhibitor-like protein [Kitasatospora sp. NPDC008050]|uniref:YbhB/YbcL family Raf kinase inhibitor-like protein n=1 Tax=Kitasatospora sp. NPDC008050 TaxID=3364021 RepID=UPI0036EDEC14
MKVSKLRVALVTAALGIGAGTAYCASVGSAAASSTAASTSAQTQEQSHHHSVPNPYEFLPKVPSFKAVSTTVRNGHPLPLAQLSGVFGVPGGRDISPELSWSGFPKTTKSFVVSMYDPEAPTGSGFWHWIVADIPATATSLPENAGAPGSTTLPAGAIQLDGDAGTARYIGGAPPAGSGIHDYYITVTALDESSTGLGATTSGALFNFEIDSHTIARATIICPTAIESSHR